MSENASAGYDNTPYLYLEDQVSGGYTTLSNEEIAAKIATFEGVLAQDGVQPRAAETTRKLLGRLYFERQSRAGAFNDSVAEQLVDGADGEVLQTEDGEVVFSLVFTDEIPSSLTTTENQ